MHKESRNEYFTCNCRDAACCIAISRRVDKEYRCDELIINAQLNHYLPWYKRIKYAFLFLLGKPVKQCHWAEIIVKTDDFIEKIVELSERNLDDEP